MEEDVKILLEFQANCPNVRLIKNQLTEKQAEELLSEFPLKEIKRQLNAMDNRADLMKRYSSVYLTILRWFEIDIRKGFYKPEPVRRVNDIFIDERKQFLNQHPIGSIVRLGNFNYEVVDEHGLFSEENSSFMPIDTAISIIQNNQHTRRSNAKKASNN